MEKETGTVRKNASFQLTRSDGSGNKDAGTTTNKSVIPSLSLPKGGGAIRGMGEKFSTNPVTGTGSMSVPVFTTPGRSGFGPQLSLSYDSGAGNGIFGFGWNISLPSITRKTDKGLPRYQDAVESDVFILSGAEDLVPGDPLPDRGNYSIRKYRPRTEGLFARIECWTDKQSGDTFWRSISKDNITTIYGRTADSRIIDPSDPDRVFSWLISLSYDDKGNAIVYDYDEVDPALVDKSPVHEKNRTDDIRKTNRYLRSIFYGNKVPYQWTDPPGYVPEPINKDDWLFEVVFDYCRPDSTRSPEKQNTPWKERPDSFSSYRSGFEIRTYRLCYRILMFHHFPQELKIQNYLVRSMDFTYEEGPVASFIKSVTQSGYVLKKDTYTKKSLPPLDFVYSEAKIHDEIEYIDGESLRNLPIGLDGSHYQWVDLDGEGISGILAEQGDTWYYKPNLGKGTFGEMQAVASRPATADLAGGRQQLMDLAGDGSLDLVEFSSPVSGFYERTPYGNWDQFRPFASLPNILWNNPNLKFVDLNGDGHADVLVAEGESFSWYPSLAESGFSPSVKVYLPTNEEIGPRLIFADGTQSIYLADLSGDGLSDMVSIRNGEVCYWPNLGYGKFGAKVTMDNSPVFDTPDLFDQKRIRLVDVDGSGTTDILYLRHDCVDVYLNESGNRWSGAQSITQLPPIDDLSSVMTADLFGNGTGCLVWSSPLPGITARQMSFIRLMGMQKPHLLISTKNNMGAETVVTYTPSVEFYLADKAAGTPWVTRLPFPVHVVSRVDTYDLISRNLFITQYKYHHGYFDGFEREFRGFGMVEQQDTEEYAALIRNDAFPDIPGATNIDAASHMPPVVTKTWYHTGAYQQGDMISLHMAHEYYGAPDPNNTSAFDAFLRILLPDTVLPENLTAEEEREACRALRGSILRQEIYAEDGTKKEGLPYSVSERNYAVRCLQHRDDNRHAVFFVHPWETIDYHYERNISDPRISHAMTFEVDEFGNVLKSAAIGYGRLGVDSDLSDTDQKKQNTPLITYTENRVTNSIDLPDDYRTPLPSETRTYELTGVPKPAAQTWYQFNNFIDILADGQVQLRSDIETDYEKPVIYQDTPNPSGLWERRLIEHVRTLYRSNTLDGLLTLDKMESLVLPGETYKLAFTSGLLSMVYHREKKDKSLEFLLTDSTQMLQDEGGYILSRNLKNIRDPYNESLFPAEDPDDHWWIPSGRIYYCSDLADEDIYAKSHFYLPHRFDDPFGNSTIISYDMYCLQLTKTTDPLNNTVTASDPDYRVMQPSMITDPNGNRSAVAFDILGMVVGTAVMGKEGRDEGDTLGNFDPDPDYDTVIKNHLLNPTGILPTPAVDPHTLLQGATTRLIYDLFAYDRTRDDAEPQPNLVYTIIRETHYYDELKTGTKTKVQHSFSYSDGFGREIQKKIQAEPGPIPVRGSEGKIIVNADGSVLMTDYDVTPRWVGSGWTVFNNKGKPVQQYEPFFTERHEFEFDVRIGVSPVLFYDPVGRVVAALHPNNTYEKVVFDPWQQKTYDVNDTVAMDPRNDPDISGYVAAYFNQIAPVPDTWKTWLLQRGIDPNNPPDDSPRLDPEKKAAIRTLIHADTPTTAYFDALGRTFLTVALVDNSGSDESRIRTRIILDIEGNQREVIDALDRQAMKYDYDMLSNPIRQQSIDAGNRWMLNDVTGNPVYRWDNLNRTIRHEFDALRRPTHLWIQENADAAHLAERTIYGEIHPDSNPSGGNPAPLELNLRGKIFLQLDGAGMVINSGKNPGSLGEEAYDFKGNLLRSIRQCAIEYTKRPDWKGVEDNLKTDLESQTDQSFINPDTLAAFLTNLGSLLKPETFASSTTYDALNRPVSLTTPDNSITCHTYNEANLLESVSVNLRGAITSTQFVRDIDYTAKGQREFIEYGNNVKTSYEYDPLTFRLTHIHAVRGSGFSGDCLNPEPCSDPPLKCPKDWQNPCGLQNLHYTYDPVGNIVHIRDDAQQTIYVSGSIVQPQSDYTYDAIYRLIKVSGREHQGSAEQPWPTWHDMDRTCLPQPGNVQQMRNYTEYYCYDNVGNIDQIQHSASNGNGTNPNNWTRSFTIEPDPLDPIHKKKSNRLISTTIGKDTNPNKITESYSYDNHGNMISMPHLPHMSWDFEDQLQSVQKSGEIDDPCKGCVVYFTYDAGGQRVRKVVKQDGKLLNERFYVGGFEVFRKYNGSSTGPILERESLHVMDDKQRITLVDTKTVDTKTTGTPLPETLIRYQFGNHLGSTALELDENADVISYEEYYPYGTTSYQAVRGNKPGSVEVNRKRYRYTGKERDKETGLYYHGARYYVPWLGRWVSCDPIGLRDGTNLYLYVRGNPLRFIDQNGKQGVPWASSNPEERDLWVRILICGPSAVGADLLNREAKHLLSNPSPFFTRETKEMAENPPPSFSQQTTDNPINYKARNLAAQEAMKTVGGGLFFSSFLAFFAYMEGYTPELQVKAGIMGEIAYGAGFGPTVGVGSFNAYTTMQLNRRLNYTPPQQYLDEPRDFYASVKGQRFQLADPVKTRWYWQSVNQEQEFVAVTLNSGGWIRGQGNATSVGLNVPELEVSSTLHTHITRGVALFSGRDLKLYLRYPGTSEHGVLGLKWPNTFKTLNLMGLEAKGVERDVVETTIQTNQITKSTVSKIKVD